MATTKTTPMIERRALHNPNITSDGGLIIRYVTNDLLFQRFFNRTHSPNNFTMAKRSYKFAAKPWAITRYNEAIWLKISKIEYLCGDLVSEFIAHYYTNQNMENKNG